MALHRCQLVACLFFCLALPLHSRAETAIERGGYLVESIGNCGNCHAPQQPSGAVPLTPLSGGPAIATPAFTAYPPNITPDPDSGIGAWTEDQFVTALREGHTPDGRMLRVPMPIAFYRGVSDEDAHAIAAYVLSRPPVPGKALQSEYRIAVPASYGPPVGHVAGPPRGNTVAYGAYLGNMGHCMLCHTPIGANGQRDYAHRLGAGGWLMTGHFGRIVTPNITPDKETGLGGWTDAEISQTLHTGARPDGRRLASPMPVAFLARLTPQDTAAVVTWLRSLPPVNNPVER